MKSGTNGTIMMIHGFGCGPWHFDKYKKYFEENNYRCLTPALRFHEKKFQKNPNEDLGTTGILDYVGDLEKEIKELDTKPILIGHSLGSMMTQILAARGLCKAAVLLAPAYPFGVWSLNLPAIRCFIFIPTWGWWKRPVKLSFEHVEDFMLRKVPTQEHKEIYNGMGYESGRAFFQTAFWFFDIKRTTTVDSKKVKCPVLIISGKNDKISLVEVGRKVAKKYKNVSTYLELENQDHWLIGETGWQEIAHSILNWLKNNPRGF